jgi:hypothetical protein
MYGFIKETRFHHNFITGNGKCYHIYRRGTHLEAGYIWTPYIPMVVFTDSEYTPRPTIQSRYRSRMIDNNLYGTVRITETE